MYQAKLYERIEKKDGEEGWRKIGTMEHPGTNAIVVTETTLTALKKMGKDADRVERIMIEKRPDAAVGTFKIAPPKKAKQK